jgi:hypothetical protein
VHSFEDNLTAVWRDVEVANVEIGSEVGSTVARPPVSSSMSQRFLC